MCGNRVEELESRVKELEASVTGLTDELVECKVRVRELENAVDEELGFIPGHEFGEATDPETEGDSSKADPAEEATEEADSDIIVA
ncbi:MAG: hypothetical protein ACI9CA_001720 [Natronomonas sp.]|jgi:hypothetical protein